MTKNQMQMIADYILKEEGKDPVQVIRNGRRVCSIASIRRSRRTGRWVRKISIAEYIFTEYPEEVQLAEIIHECCHFLGIQENRCLDHGYDFRRKQDKWLAEFGLKAIGYKKAYYTHIRNWCGNLVPIRRKYEDRDHYQRRPRRETPQVTAQELSLAYEQVGETFIHKGRRYKITQINSRNPKFPIIAQDQLKGRRYKFRPTILSKIEKKEEHSVFHFDSKESFSII